MYFLVKGCVNLGNISDRVISFLKGGKTMAFCNFLTILRMFVKIKLGEIIASGHHHIVVKTGWKPDQVWIRTENNRHHSGCEQSMDMFSTEIHPDGFTLICNVHGSRRRVHWVAIKLK